VEMKKMQWNNSLSIGIEQIDKQHKKWMEHFNNAAAAIEANQTPTQISKTLGFLIDYTEVHFSTEEKYMTELGYAGLPEHKAKHDELRSTLANLVKDFEDEGVTSKLAAAIDSFLGNWLIQHIHEIDTKFAAFAKKNQAALS
jgi:hemerythrin